MGRYFGAAAVFERGGWRGEGLKIVWTSWLQKDQVPNLPATNPNLDPCGDINEPTFKSSREEIQGSCGAHFPALKLKLLKARRKGGFHWQGWLTSFVFMTIIC
jgi:hypothetical protein